MAVENSVHEHAEQIAGVMSVICTRTLNHFAEEAKMNGESLKDAFERYDIDYAWHVLGSARLHEETVSLLETRQGQLASEAQKARIAGVLQSAALAQTSELLMSFDNDVSEKLADLLRAAATAQETSPPAAKAG